VDFCGANHDHVKSVSQSSAARGREQPVCAARCAQGEQPLLARMVRRAQKGEGATMKLYDDSDTAWLSHCATIGAVQRLLEFRDIGAKRLEMLLSALQANAREPRK
jgi:hypothetical protein